MVFKTRIMGQTGSGKKPSAHKVPLIIKTVLKLASINGYDDQLRIRNSNGQFLDNTNLVDHMTYCMSEGRKLNAEAEFIALLAEADVDPMWIPNENVRAKLMAYSGKRATPAQYRPHPSQLPKRPPAPTSTRSPTPRTSRTFTEIAPPKEIINFDVQDVNDQQETDDEELQSQQGSVEFELNEDEPPEVEQHPPVEQDDVVTPILSKNRIRPKILVDRDKLNRKKRLNGSRDLANLDWAALDLGEPLQTRSGKRPRWDELPPIPDDDTGL